MTVTAYHARQVIDGVSDAPLEGATLIVEDGKIAAVSPGFVAPEGATVVDLRQATLLPGLIDCHVHLPFDGSSDPVAAFSKLSIPMAAFQALIHAQQLLREGITTVRDVSTPHGVSIALRDAIEAGMVKGPRILAAGTHICMTGGHGVAFGIEADGPYEMRKAVRRQISEGADFVKIMLTGGVYSLRQQPGSVQLLEDELRAAVEVAHMAGRKVCCHAEGEEGIRLALETGCDTIEHGNLLTQELAERMAQSAVYLVPTIVSFKAVAEASGIPEAFSNKARVMLEASRNCVRLAHQAGVKVATGTDSGTGINLSWSGHSLVREIGLFIEKGGYSPMAAIKAATVGSAKALGVNDVVGSLQPGKAADVIAVVGNPLSDLEVLKAPVLVLRGGEVVG